MHGYRSLVVAIVILFAAGCVTTVPAYGQENFNETKFVTGTPCPSIQFKNVEYYSRSEVATNDLKGKWLALEFWSKHCSSCVESFPTINELQKKFKDELQFILIGANDSKYNSNIREMYEKFRIKQHLSIAVTYDSSLFERFGIKATPQLILIDPNGMVRAVTIPAHLTADSLKNMFASTRVLAETDNRKMRFTAIDADTGSNRDRLIFRSSLYEWKKGEPFSILTRIDQSIDRGGFFSSGTSLHRLFLLAYFGRSDWQYGDSLYGNCWPPIEVDEPGNNPRLKKINDRHALFDYSLELPNEDLSKENLQKILQQELCNYLHCRVSIRNELKPYWKLVATDEAKVKLLSTQQTESYQGDHAGFSLTHSTVDQLIRIISGYHPNDPPILNETGITKPIDITIDALLTELDDIQIALQKNGLALIKGEKMMQVLVVGSEK